MVRWLSALVLALLCLPASSALANPDHGLFVYAAGEVWNSDAIFGHGIGIVSGRGDLGDASYLAEFNTDTLKLRADRILIGRAEIGFQLRGEVYNAGLLPDYYVGGKRQVENGMRAGFAEAQFDVKGGYDVQFIHYRLTPRRWFFSKTDETSDAFVLPEDMWSIEQELGLTLWLIEPDPSWYQPQMATLRRVSGFGFGARFVSDWRGKRGRWGAPGGTRNDPGKMVNYGRQWLHVGWQYTPALRLQLRQEAGWGWNEDDLSRQRIGGMNAYVIPIAGTPWASFLASRYMSAQLSQRIRIFGETEVGVLIDAAMIQDIERQNNRDRYGLAMGFGALIDARFGSWNVDGQFGVAPDTGWFNMEGPLFSGYVGLGYALQ